MDLISQLNISRTNIRTVKVKSPRKKLFVAILQKIPLIKAKNAQIKKVKFSIFSPPFEF
jgi:hypothetical protein